MRTAEQVWVDAQLPRVADDLGVYGRARRPLCGCCERRRRRVCCGGGAAAAEPLRQLAQAARPQPRRHTAPRRLKKRARVCARHFQRPPPVLAASSCAALRRGIVRYAARCVAAWGRRRRRPRAAASAARCRALCRTSQPRGPRLRLCSRLAARLMSWMTWRTYWAGRRRCRCRLPQTAGAQRSRQRASVSSVV